MSQCTRMRGFAAWLVVAIALAVPFAGPVAADEEPQADESKSTTQESEEAEPAEPDEEDAAEEEGDEEEETDWSVTHRGIYFMGHATYAFMTARSDLEDEARDAAELGAVNSNVDDSWGFGLRLGYRLMERLALEGQFEFLNNIAIHQRLESDGSTNNSDATFLTATGNAKAYLLTQRLQPYVLAGLGYGYAELDPSGGRTKDRNHGFAARFGIGTDFYVTDDVGLMTEVAYALPTGDISAYDNVAIDFGVFLRFYAD